MVKLLHWLKNSDRRYLLIQGPRPEIDAELENYHVPLTLLIEYRYFAIHYMYNPRDFRYRSAPFGCRHVTSYPLLQSSQTIPWRTEGGSLAFNIMGIRVPH